MKQFDSLAAFAAHLTATAVAMAEANAEAIKRAAALVESSAKAELGHYQPESGPFNAWSPLAQSTLATHARYGVGDTPLLLTGKLRDSIRHEVAGHEAIVGTKMEIGAYQEVGTSKIPPRPFMGPAAFNNLDAIRQLIGKSSAQALAYGARGAFIGLDHVKAA